MEPFVSKYKSSDNAVARERILKKLLARYWNDDEYRNVKNEETKSDHGR